MEEGRQTSESAWLEQIVVQIRQAPGEIMRLPPAERRMAELALAGEDVHSIAQRVRFSERSVWDFLANLARSIGGSLPERPVEIAGLGADLDPGVTGGYGDTFDDVGNEPPTTVAQEEKRPAKGRQGQFTQRPRRHREGAKRSGPEGSAKERRADK